jgi:hypothetical protein
MEKITFSWANPEKTILLCTYNTDDWTWTDFYDAMKRQRELLDTVDHAKVHIIVDVRNSRLLPKGGSLVSGSRSLSDQKHPRQGHTVVVGASNLISAIVNVAGKLMGEHRKEMHLAKTMEEAHETIAQLMKPSAKR